MQRIGEQAPHGKSSTKLELENEIKRDDLLPSGEEREDEKVPPAEELPLGDEIYSATAHA